MINKIQMKHIGLELLVKEALRYKSAEEFINALKNRIVKKTHRPTEVTYKWIQLLPELDSVRLGYANESDDVIIQRGITYYKRKIEENKIDRELTKKYPNRIIEIGPLPAPELDIDFQGKYGIYFYVLKERRKKGKYQIEEAIRIPDIPEEDLNLTDFYNQVIKEARKIK